MIRNSEPISMAEMSKYLNKDEDSEAAFLTFIKKCTKLKEGKAIELKRDIEGLGIIKINEKHICKIIDFLPESPEELNKISADIELDEDETGKILETIKKFK